MITQLLTQVSLCVFVRSSVPRGCDTSFPTPVVTLLLLLTQVYEFKSALSPGVEHSIRSRLCLSLYLCTHMFAHPCPSILFSAHVSTLLLIRLSLYPLASYSLFVISSSHHLSLSPPACPSLCCLSIHPSFYPSVCPPPSPLSTPVSIRQAFT